MKEITSRHNAKFKMWLSLLESKGIKREGLCLVSGSKIISELAQPSVVEFLVPPKTAAPNDVAPCTRLPAELFRELDISGAKGPLAVVKIPLPSKWEGGAPKGLQVIAAMSDPQNLGALIRSCEAFGVERIILTQESSSPFLPKAIRASSGSVFRVPISTAGSIYSLTAERAYGLDLAGQNIYGLVWPRDMYLVVGEEGQGLPGSLKLTRVKVPMAKTIDSLNAMAAASVALFSYRQRFPL